MQVGWIPPDFVDSDISHFLVHIKPATGGDGQHPTHNVTKAQREFDFKDLKPVTSYNVTIKGIGYNNGAPYNVWVAQQMFATADSARGPLHWLLAPTNLHLIEKSHKMMHVRWDPPEIPEHQRRLMTHYRVTIAKFDHHTGVTEDPPKEYTIQVPTVAIRWDDLQAETVYKITVEACTANGCGEQLWGAYSTLPYPGRNHILRLKYRTPTSLRVMWKQAWGRNTPYTVNEFTH